MAVWRPSESLTHVSRGGGRGEVRRSLRPPSTLEAHCVMQPNYDPNHDNTGDTERGSWWFLDSDSLTFFLDRNPQFSKGSHKARWENISFFQLGICPSITTMKALTQSLWCTLLMHASGVCKACMGTVYPSDSSTSYTHTDTPNRATQHLKPFHLAQCNNWKTLPNNDVSAGPAWCNVPLMQKKTLKGNEQSISAVH